MHLPHSYDRHPFAARQLARARAAFALPELPAPRESFWRWRGYDVHLDLHEPAGTPAGSALLIHGAGANGRLLAPFAAPLCARGLRVIAPDLPGYGITRGNSAHTTYGEWIDLVADLARAQLAQGPLVLFGLSVGGMTALRVAQRVPGVRAVIATTLLDLGAAPQFDAVARAPMLGALARWLFRRAPALSDRLALPLRWLAPLERLTSDRALARLLARDPVLGRRAVPLRFMRSLHTHDAQRTDYDLSCPLLLVHPGADRWTPLALSQRVFDAVRSEKELIMLSGGEHAPLEPTAFSELGTAIDSFLARHVLATPDPWTARDATPAPR